MKLNIHNKKVSQQAIVTYNFYVVHNQEKRKVKFFFILSYCINANFLRLEISLLDYNYL